MKLQIEIDFCKPKKFENEKFDIEANNIITGTKENSNSEKFFWMM